MFFDVYKTSSLIGFGCRFCEYVSNRKSNVISHIETIHRNKEQSSSMNGIRNYHMFSKNEKVSDRNVNLDEIFSDIMDK